MIKILSTITMDGILTLMIGIGLGAIFTIAALYLENKLILPNH